MAVELEIKGKNQFTVHYANSPPPRAIDRRFDRSGSDNFDLVLAEVLQSQESFYKNETGESSSRGRIVHSTEIEALLALDEAIARRMQEKEMDKSLSDSETEDLACVESPSESDSDSEAGDSPRTSNSVEVTRQDNIDPDNMTYEELQRLGEEVGNENRGLSDELISYLETTKYKTGFFSKKGKHDECVICQEEYRNREKLIILPCRHNFHESCITKWLKIEKVTVTFNLLFTVVLLFIVQY
ncbi:RING/U-box superfamily protein [Rhynchospora pubera]|uniref:RING/U-box superfamily protein n=1 Tax=Rhynchospora pubera TaxID=906938 RepID=A0AAV8E8Z7_9POAL|nr:RING/U-box superfamily protein [Rhynchospora pubera]